MGLTNKREEYLRKMPIIESRVGTSKDGNYIVHRTIITNIKPRAYFEKVLENSDSKSTDYDILDVSEQAVA